MATTKTIHLHLEQEVFDAIAAKATQERRTVAAMTKLLVEDALKADDWRAIAEALLPYARSRAEDLHAQVDPDSPLADDALAAWTRADNACNLAMEALGVTS